MGFKFHVGVLALTSKFYSTEITGIGNNKYKAETLLKELPHI